MNLTSLFNRTRKRRFAFRNCFCMTDGTLSESGKQVLKVLQEFCYVYCTTAKTDTCDRVDPIAMGIAEGKRQVFNLIYKYINLSDKEFNKLMESNNE